MKELIVALDFPSPDQAIAMARHLSGQIRWIKIGLELFCQSGPAIVQTMKDLGFNVFLDLKFLDIPNTVRGAVASATRIGADMLTVHIAGGKDMITAAREGIQQKNIGPAPLLIGVTVLTSMNIKDLKGTFPLRNSADVPSIVENMSIRGQKWSLDGVVCSGQEAGMIRRQCPLPFMIVTPGIRMTQIKDDQKRVTTPAQAITSGSNFLVVGRPITMANDPLATAHAYLQALEK
ncbi:MAG: orotidine-5'-phosphate decarboxylase [Desulfoplanes sp.]|nr:orotidine-5'-phosphate decarboxylase [Desulfoplanes sp.]MDD4648641.1 orotidine-5'-phosphate decarboxylase [Desulfoplanes sp.]